MYQFQLGELNQNVSLVTTDFSYYLSFLLQYCELQPRVATGPGSKVWINCQRLWNFWHVTSVSFGVTCEYLKQQGVIGADMRRYHGLDLHLREYSRNLLSRVEWFESINCLVSEAIVWRYISITHLLQLQISMKMFCYGSWYQINTWIVLDL